MTTYGANPDTARLISGRVRQVKKLMRDGMDIASAITEERVTA